MRLLKNIIAAAVLGALFWQSAGAEKLVIIHTNDTHSLIDPDHDGLGGVARRKVIIDSIRAEHPGHTLLVDAGDMVQGTLFFNLYYGEPEEKLMNALGYDIRILGNHEFDNGLEAMAKNFEGAQADLLSTNYQFHGTPLEGVFKRYTIKEIDGKRIGFIGINIDPDGIISKRNYVGMRYTDAVEAANLTAQYLKEIEQVDAVVALTHIGYTDEYQPNDPGLAAASKYIDLIIGGHSHTKVDPASGRLAHVFNNAEGKPVVVAQTGKDGKAVGEIKIDLDSLGLGATPSYRLITVDSRLDDRLDPEIAEIIEPYRKSVDELNTRFIATAPHDLAHRGTEIVNFAADFIEKQGREMVPDLDFAIINKGGLRHAIPKGKVSEGDIITLMPFFNRIRVVELKGEKVVEVFDSIAAKGGNGVSAQVYAEYDQKAKHCPVLLLNGKPIDPEKTYKIATIDYLSEGGDYMKGFTAGKVIAESPDYLFNDLVAYLKKVKKISASTKPRMVPAKAK